MALVVDKNALIELGAKIKAYLEAHKSDRRPLELQWLKNLRQYRGIYDDDILKLIPADKSKSYPRDTRVKVKASVAKLMELMFPGQEQNWELAVSPVPSIAKSDLDLIISSLEEEEAAKAAQEQRQPMPITSDAIERRVKQFADERKNDMEQEIADQLADEGTDYPQICKKVIRSGTIYGFGVVNSPLVRKQKERVWVVNEETGSYEAKVETKRRPYIKNVRVWDIFPDLSAINWIAQDRIFERIVMNRHDLAMLVDREDFFADALKEYLRNHSGGNYKEESYETSLRTLNNASSVTDRTSRLYEIYRHLGFVSAHELAQVTGAEIAEEDMHKDILADIWIIDNTVIKAQVSPFGDRPSDQYPAFVAHEDEDSGLTGIGLPEDLRDSQMGLCAATRALLDNMAASAGPIIEVNEDLLPMGRRNIGSIHSFKVIPRTGDGVTANYPALRAVRIPNHTANILSIINSQRQQLDLESTLPSWTFGMTQNLGEAFRTSNNMSMLTGGAALISKDTVRAFDVFTTQVIGGFLKWNMKYNDKKEIKGDFGVRAKGTISLVAKEVRGAALDQFLLTLGPEDREMFDMYGLNLDRLRARDLPTDRLYPREEAAQRIASMRQAQSDAAALEGQLTQAKAAQAMATAKKTEAQAGTIQAMADSTIQEILSRVDANIKLADNEISRTQLENLRTLLQAAEQTPTQ